jgi:hypothetical protein
MVLHRHASEFFRTTDTIDRTQNISRLGRTDRYKQTLGVHHNVWAAQTDVNRHCVFITMYGLHRQM